MKLSVLVDAHRTRDAAPPGSREARFEEFPERVFWLVVSFALCLIDFTRLFVISSPTKTVCPGEREIDSDAGPERIGITAPSDHPVFSVVGERLVEGGYSVSYFDANTAIDREELKELALFVHKQTRPASVRALITAERLGVRTWNSATGVVACVSRFSQLCLLSGVGFAVPVASRTKPTGDYVAKGLYHWDTTPEVNADGDVYEELLPADPIDFKYYVVNTGTSFRTTVLRATSKLWGEKRILGVTDPRQEHVDRITSLMERLDMRGIGVDVIRTDDGWYAVDINPCPSFTQTNLENALVDSIESCLDE